MIRWGPSHLLLKQYRGGEWLLGFDSGGMGIERTLAIFADMEIDSFIRYVPETDVLLVLGTVANHNQIRNVICDLSK